MILYICRFSEIYVSTLIITIIASDICRQFEISDTHMATCNNLRYQKTNIANATQNTTCARAINYQKYRCDYPTEKRERSVSRENVILEMVLGYYDL